MEHGILYTVTVEIPTSLQKKCATKYTTTSIYDN